MKRLYILSELNGLTFLCVFASPIFDLVLSVIVFKLVLPADAIRDVIIFDTQTQTIVFYVESSYFHTRI